jgi:hypothetical protein
MFVNETIFSSNVILFEVLAVAIAFIDAETILGAIVSTVTVAVSAVDILPAASTALIVKVCNASDNHTHGVYD